VQSPKNNTQLHPVLTVTQLTNQLRDTLENAFQQVYVVGEVSNAKVYPSGHWYFSLKDKESNLSCVSFKSANSLLKFRLEDGLMVVARGKMNVYPPKGTYQLVASHLEPVGVGEWQLAFDQLRTKLEREGLLHPDRKQPIPIWPRRIGVVTSPVGAAIRDVLSALYRRNKNVNVVVAPVKVQGDGSAEEIAAAIDHLHRIPNIDVIILARGGGSIEDLWAFNTEVVARAVADSAIPIISGVGHETDITICDLAADLRAPTPTAAAELVAKGSAEIQEKWSFLHRQLGLRTQAHLSDARAKLEKLKPLHVLLRYSERLKRNRQKVNYLLERMERNMSHSLDRAQRRWRQRDEKLGALGPLNVLARGFAIIRDANGHIIRDPLDVQEGDAVSALLKSGELYLRVAKQPTVDQLNIEMNNDDTAVQPERIEDALAASEQNAPPATAAPIEMPSAPPVVALPTAEQQKRTVRQDPAGVLPDDVVEYTQLSIIQE
jgi:exodeoxyribonuclease VII large subunit